MIQPYVWPDKIPLQYTIKSRMDPGSLSLNFEWQRFGTRSEIVEAQADLVAALTPGRGIRYPREYTIACGPLILDRFARNADGSWTHHDLVARRATPVVLASRELD
jgi:hypothetical protein